MARCERKVNEGRIPVGTESGGSWEGGARIRGGGELGSLEERGPNRRGQGQEMGRVCGLRQQGSEKGLETWSEVRI